jgi:hypothetical protein
VSKAIATGICFAALMGFASPALSDSCLPNKQAQKSVHVQTAQSSVHKSYRVAERRERPRYYTARSEGSYYVYDDGYAPRPYWHDGGYWVWHPTEEDDGPYARW